VKVLTVRQSTGKRKKDGGLPLRWPQLLAKKDGETSYFLSIQIRVAKSSEVLKDLREM
jgi:hypothetical protein